jgi:FKBP-type peptidyl-prolyl cis-trans isomerase
MRQVHLKYLLFALLSLSLVQLVSCGTDTKALEQKEANEIQSYLNHNPDINFVLKESGLYYYEKNAGTGLQANTHDTAYVMFTLKKLDDTQLFTNVGTTDTLVLIVNEGFMISGFDEGITYMKVGGNSTFLVPSKLAYGNTGNYAGTIAGYTPLVFEVLLARIKPGPGSK